jgi:hypothetical protein
LATSEAQLRTHYEYGPVRDFLTYPYETNAVDWVITNPPFDLLSSSFSGCSLFALRRVCLLYGCISYRLTVPALNLHPRYNIAQTTTIDVIIPPRR